MKVLYDIITFASIFVSLVGLYFMLEFLSKLGSI